VILPAPAIEIIGLAVTALAALVIVWKGLVVPALLGLLVYAWTCLAADRFVGVKGPAPGTCGPVQIPARMRAPGSAPRWPAAAAGTLVGVLVITAFVLLIVWSVRLGSTAELRTFLLRIEGSLDILRHALPDWAAVSIPEDLAQLQSQLFALLRSKAAMLSGVGGSVVHSLIEAVFAILVGTLAAVATWQPGRLLSDRLFIARLLLVLERVVIAQLKIAVFNSTMTALYLFVILPAFGYQLPFRGLLVLFTLVTGVLPVLGNLLANTVLALISFAVSPWLAISSLIYLIAIHKTEYFINARTVGARVQVASWEILAAMLTGEAVFGVPGLVTAPLLYPFFKRELMRWRRSTLAARAAPVAARDAALDVALVPAQDAGLDAAVDAGLATTLDTGIRATPDTVPDIRPGTRPDTVPDTVPEAVAATAETPVQAVPGAFAGGNRGAGGARGSGRPAAREGTIEPDAATASTGAARAAAPGSAAPPSATPTHWPPRRIRVVPSKP
jgi:predicted PurR-regulated permease PerM